MLDTLEEEMVADRPEEEYMLEGVVVEEIQEEDDESLSEAAEGGSSKKAVDHSDKRIRSHTVTWSARLAAMLRLSSNSTLRRVVELGLFQNSF